MSQEKRSLLAALLSLLVFFLWYEFYAKGNLPKWMKSPETPTEKSDVTAAGPKEAKKESQPAKPLPPVVGPEEKVRKTNGLFEAVFTSYGGKISQFFLNHFRETTSRESPPVNLLPFPEDEVATLTCRDCNFSLPENQNYRFLPSTAPEEVVFETYDGGILLRKSYHWSDQYLLNMKVTLINNTSETLQGVLGLQVVSHQKGEKKKGFLSFLQPPAGQKEFVYQVGGHVERFGQKEGSREATGMVTWGGIEDHYFLTAVIARKISSEGAIDLTRSGETLTLSFAAPPLTLGPKGEQEEEFSLYLGPKDRGRLQVAGVGLEKTVDYGWFGIVAIPIAELLKLFHGWVKNWGVAIILLTIFVKILMNPLTIKSMQQMKEMQKLQPEIQRLKEKFKNDRQRLNMETMQLFKTHKVNPMGGCLPMLLQMPIYIALYKVLYNSIEIYHAPFVWFYRDLSAPDPFFILPILLGVAMVIQQKMTPQASVDPTQRQMMMIMPVMFTAFMLFLPVGLVIYIFVNTIMGLIQQYMSQKDIRWRDLLRFSLQRT